ncbi:MAG: LysR family transcriptional regulator, partial [Roseovarius sp.]
VDLRVAQPSLSKNIRCLEMDLGAELLERTATGVTPTVAGARLYDHCGRVFEQLTKAYDDVRAAQRTGTTLLRIGIPYSVNVVLAAPLLRETLAHCPDIELKIVEDHSADLVDDLIAERIDLAIVVAEGMVRAELAAEPLIRERFVLVRAEGASAESLPREGVVSVHDLADVPLILAKGQLRMMLEDRFARHALRSGPIMEMDNFSMIPQCVEAGISSTILPAGWAGAFGPRNTVRLPFAEEDMQRRVMMCTASPRPPSEPLRRLRALVRETVGALIASGHWAGAVAEG